MMQDNSKSRGRIIAETFDEKGNLERRNEYENTINLDYKEAVASLLAGGADVIEIDSVRIGSTDSTFTESSSGLGTPISGGDVSPTSVTASSKTVTIVAQYGLGVVGQVEEAALYAGSTIIALNSNISEEKLTNKVLRITWVLTIN